MIERLDRRTDYRLGNRNAEAHDIRGEGELILIRLRQGDYFKTACDRAGVPYSTAKRWLRLGREGEGGTWGNYTCREEHVWFYEMVKYTLAELEALPSITGCRPSRTATGKPPATSWRGAFPGAGALPCVAIPTFLAKRQQRLTSSAAKAIRHPPANQLTPPRRPLHRRISSQLNQLNLDSRRANRCRLSHQRRRRLLPKL